jgi:hypothetical protein
MTIFITERESERRDISREMREREENFLKKKNLR